jgi:hypothetical protein
MATKDLLKNKRHILITELESIKNLLGSGGEAEDNIPLLKDPLPSPSQEAASQNVFFAATVKNTINHQPDHHQADTTGPSNISDDGIQQNTLVDPSTVVFPAGDTNSVLESTGILLGQHSLFADTKVKATTHRTDERPTVDNDEYRKAASLTENPFLPAHIRQRFKDQHAISRTTESTIDHFTASAAEDPTESLTEKSLPEHDDKPPFPATASYTQQLIDQLIAHHLPQIEAELRRKLGEVVKSHHHQLPK